VKSATPERKVSNLAFIHSGECTILLKNSLNLQPEKYLVMLFNLAAHNTVANQFIAELRHVNIQQDRMRFRRNLERIGEILAYEISKTLDYHIVATDTQLGIADVSVPSQRLVLGTILRAGLPFHQGLLNYFDRADNAFVSAYRRNHKDGTFEIQLDYVSAPDLHDSVLILADPMLATGASIKVALKEMARFGAPHTLHVAAVIASTAGIEAVREAAPNARIWVGAIDEELTAKSYIVPGLGDAGDLAYGEKK
jgi:uracil phosphoribosyltransferase